VDIKKDNFSVGDWVIMNEEYKNSLKKKFGLTAKIYIMNFNYPQQIQKIFNSDKDILVFSQNRKMWNKAFRLATEKEIREQNIKNIFL
jgi:hypothetical protein